MKLTFSLCLLTTLLSSAFGAPSGGPLLSTPVVVDPLPGIVWATPDVLAALPPFEGGPPPDDVDESFEAEKLQNLRSGIIGDQYRWGPNIDFQISTAYSTAEYNTIYEGLQVFAGIFSGCRTIRLYEQTATPSGDYVFIQKVDGCSSRVGRGGGRQTLNLAANCLTRSSATSTHEMIHAAGFHHEQIRPDRDQFVNILWQNIEGGREHNFQSNPLYGLTFGVPYDYYSIMHYQERDFSSNGGKTIEAWNGVVVGSRGVVTDYDRRKIRAMYNCA